MTSTGPSNPKPHVYAQSLLFESLVVRDLRIYGQRHDATVYHYRDSDELEADMIVETRGGRWMAVEAKLGGEDWIEEAADSLLRLSRKVDVDKVGAPSKLLPNCSLSPRPATATTAPTGPLSSRSPPSAPDDRMASVSPIRVGIHR